MQTTSPLPAERNKLPSDNANCSTGLQGVRSLLGDASMNTSEYGIAAMRRGSYDDAAASLRPVSINQPSKGKDPVSVDLRV